MALQESGEMYLEAIYVISNQKKAVRSIDVAEHLGYSKPSVSRAVGILKREDYITVGTDGYILLTDKGRDAAVKLFERHTMLSNLLMSLGVDEETATDDACRIEHVISERSFEAIKKHIEEKR